jgi:hypothetical protein
LLGQDSSEGWQQPTKSFDIASRQEHDAPPGSFRDALDHYDHPFISPNEMPFSMYLLGEHI